MWNVEWSVSSIKHKATFDRYADAINYLESIIKDFGKIYKIEVRMWESK